MDVPVDAVAESLAQRWEALRPHLNERQRRLWLGAEARELGSGGAARVATVLGVSADTVWRGRAELNNPEIVPDLGLSRVWQGWSRSRWSWHFDHERRWVSRVGAGCRVGGAGFHYRVLGPGSQGERTVDGVAVVAVCRSLRVGT